MKRFGAVLMLLLVVALAFGLAGCGASDKDTLQGMWVYEEEEETGIIFSGTEFICAYDGEEFLRGVFEVVTPAKKKENGVLRFKTQAITQYVFGQDNFVVIPWVTDEEYLASYRFEKDGNVERFFLDGLEELVSYPPGLLVRKEIDKNFIAGVQEAYQQNLLNVDFRRVRRSNGVNYASHFTMEDFRAMASQGSFDGFVQDNDVKAGAYKDGVLYWSGGGMFFFVALSGLNEPVKKGDIVMLGYPESAQEVGPIDNYVPAVFQGEDQTLYYTASTWGILRLATKRVYGTMRFEAGSPKIEIIAFETER